MQLRTRPHNSMNYSCLWTEETEKHSLSDLPTVRKCGLIPLCSLRPPWLTLRYKCLRPAGGVGPLPECGLVERGDKHKWLCPFTSLSSVSPQRHLGSGPFFPPSLRLRALRLPSGPGLPAASVLIPLPFIMGTLLDVCAEKQMCSPFSKSCETSHTETAG